MIRILPHHVTTMRPSVVLAATWMSALTRVTFVSLVSLIWMAALLRPASCAWLGCTQREARLHVPTVLRVELITTQMHPHHVCRAWLEK